MSYDIKFRLRVVDNIIKEMSWNEDISIFRLSRSTISLWLKEYKNTGSFTQKERKTYKPRKVDPDALKLAIEKDPDATLSELSHQFNCWPPAIYYRCKKLNITRKKTTLYLERNEEKRQEYLSKLLLLSPNKIIYMDESGIDSSLQRNYARSERGKQAKSDVSGKKNGAYICYFRMASLRKKVYFSLCF